MQKTNYLIIYIITIFIILSCQSTTLTSQNINVINEKKQSGYVPFPKILWAYWSSEKQMGDLERHFYMRIQKFMKLQTNKEWKFILLTDQNLKDYIQNFQECQKIINSVQVITPANKADIVRLFILQQHGGVYFDITSAFVQDLNWLTLESLLKNSLVINKHQIHSPQPDVLMFYGIFHQYRNEYYDQYNTLRNDFPGYETWFIGSKKDAVFIKDWKNKLIEYYSASADYIFEDMRAHDIFFSNFYYETYHNVYLALYFVLQQKQKQLDFNTTLSNRNYVNLHYKVWAINCDCGPCMVYGEQIRQESYPKYFFNRPDEQLASLFGQQKVKYFIKFTHYHLNGFREILAKMTQQQIFQKSLVEYYQAQVKYNSIQKPYLKNCQNFTLFLGNESFVSKYVFADYQDDGLSRIKTFSQQQISEFEQYCHQLDTSINYDELIDKIASLNLKKYLEDIVLGGFLICTFCLILVYVLCCNESHNDNFMKNMSKYKKHIQSSQTYDLYVMLARNLDHFFKNHLNIQVHYYFITILLTVFLVYRFFIGQVLNVREQFNSVFFIFIITKITQNFTKIHSKMTHVPNHIVTFFRTIQNLCLSKLIAQLIFNQPNYFYFGTIFIGIFGQTVIQNIQNDHLFFKQCNQMIKFIHKYLITLILFAFAFIPNLKYAILKGEYLTYRVYQMYMIYIWLLVLITILLEIQNFIYTYTQKNMKNPLHCSKKILFAYWITLALAVFYDSYWNYIYFAEVMMSRRTFLFGVICLYSSTKYEYSRSVVKQRVFSIFSLFLGGSIIILTYMFAELYQILIEIQSNRSIFTMLFDIFSLVFIGLAIIKVLLVICQEKKFKITPEKFKKELQNE